MDYCERCDKTEMVIDRLEDQNKILKEALEKYASTDRWMQCFDDAWSHTMLDDIEESVGGKWAREALKKCEELEK